jgi:hypothetical protein
MVEFSYYKNQLIFLAQFFEQNIENDENFGIDDNPTRLRLSSDVNDLLDTINIIIF